MIDKQWWYGLRFEKKEKGKRVGIEKEGSFGQPMKFKNEVESARIGENGIGDVDGMQRGWGSTLST